MEYIAYIHDYAIEGLREVFLQEMTSDGKSERPCLAHMVGYPIVITPRKHIVEINVCSEQSGLIGSLTADKVREKTKDGWRTYLPLED